MKTSQKKFSTIIVLACIVLVIGASIYFYINNKSIKECPFDDGMRAIAYTEYNFSFENIKTEGEKSYTEVIVKARDKCTDGRLATTEYKYNLGSYPGTCNVLLQTDKDIVGEYPQDNVKARVQCLYNGEGSFIEIYEREDFVAHIADIKEVNGKIPASKNNLRDLKMIHVIDGN